MRCHLFKFQNEAIRASDAFYRMRTFAGHHLSNADNDGFMGSIDEKVGEQKLETGCSATFVHTIEFHK